MPSSGMLRHMALVRSDVSEDTSTSETSLLTGATRHKIPEDGIVYCLCSL
jgi:hypothetical protein